jgi:hypothetical protein
MIKHHLNSADKKRARELKTTIESEEKAMARGNATEERKAAVERLQVCVCICECMYVCVARGETAGMCICVPVYVCMSVCGYDWREEEKQAAVERLQVCVSVDLCMYVYVSVCMYVWREEERKATVEGLQVYVCVCLCMYVCMYEASSCTETRKRKNTTLTHTHIHTYIQTPTHIHIQDSRMHINTTEIIFFITLRKKKYINTTA